MTNRVTPQRIFCLKKDEVFVFASNLAGHHTRGDAFRARSWGAIMGKGSGLQGSTYAIPTDSLTVEEIKPYIDDFIAFARENPERIFLVTELGIRIHDFFILQIAPLFFDAISCDNIYLPESFWEVLMGNLRGRLELVAYHHSCSFNSLVAETRGSEITPENFCRLIDAYEDSLRFIKDLSSCFPEVNVEWLKTGKGEYLYYSNTPSTNSIVEDILELL